MKAHRALRALAEIVKVYQPKTWTFESGQFDTAGYAYFHAASKREWEELTEAFWALAGERPERHDDGPTCVNQWDWNGWRLTVAVFVDAPTGYEATA